MRGLSGSKSPGLAKWRDVCFTALSANAIDPAGVLDGHGVARFACFDMRTTHLLGCVFGVVLLGAPARAQEGTPKFDPLGEKVEAPKLIRVMAEFVDLPHEELTKLLLEPRKSGNDTELRKEVQKLVVAGKATVVETMLCTCRSGQKATTESIQEMIYPTEYEPSQVSAETDTTAQGVQVKPSDAVNATGPTPTAFETRNVGSTLEIEPTLGEGNKLIDLRMVPELVYHHGDKIISVWKSEQGDASIKMPLFYSMRLNTSVTMMDGQTLLVAALSPKNAEGQVDTKRKVMVFFRCDVLEVGR